MKKEIILSISIMCSGRSSTTEKCLASLGHLRKEVPCELIITDTGCDADMRQVIEKYADKIIPFQWCNDFAKARNAGLEASSGKWFMFMDDDEYWEDDKALIDFFANGDYKKYDCGYYLVRSYTDEKYSQWRDDKVLRLIKRTEDVCFKGRIHEYLYADKISKVIVVESRIGHDGYIFLTEEDFIAHSKRNTELLLEMIKKEPNNPRWYYQISQEYSANHMYQKLMEMTEKMLNMEGLEQNYFESFLCGSMYAKEKLGLYDQLISESMVWIDDERIRDLAKARLCEKITTPLYLYGDYVNCKRICNIYMKCYEKNHDNFASAMLYGGFFIDGVFDDDVYNSILGYLIALEMKTDNLSQAKFYFDKLIWNENNLYLNKFFIISLIEKMCQIGSEKNLSSMVERICQLNGAVLMMQELMLEFLPQMSQASLDNLSSACIGGRLEGYVAELKEKYAIYRQLYLMEEKVLLQIDELIAQGNGKLADEISSQLRDTMRNAIGTETLH